MEGAKHTPIIFCSDPLDPKRPDRAFQREVDAAAMLGLPWLLVDHDALDRHDDPTTALRRLRVDGPFEAVYRGWMLRAETYAMLFDALLARGIRLVNSPDQYTACHWGPRAHPFIAQWSAPTAWISIDRVADRVALAQTLARLGAGPVVLKDWVKSQAAGYWDQACFIPSAGDSVAVERVIARFIELQGESLIGGLMFRAWRDLARVGNAVQEWRVFSVDGAPIGCWPRHSPPYREPPPDDLIRAVCRALPSRFATADFGRLRDGGWLLIEVGDGQVSGLPDAADPVVLLSAIAGPANVPQV